MEPTTEQPVIEERAVSTRPWSDFTAADYTPEQWRAACLIDKGTGDPDSKDRYALPVREPNGALNANGVHAAAGRIGQVTGVSPEKKAAAARALVRLYGQLKGDPPDDLKKLAGLHTDAAVAAASSGAGEKEERAGAMPVEERAAKIDNVNVAERILTVIAVPFEQPTQVPYRGEVWEEVFTRAAFHGFEPSKRRVPVSAVLRAPAFDHNNGHLVGKVVGVYPERQDGLILDMRIAATPAGDETLELSSNDVLSPSVGFAVRGADQQLDRRAMKRRVNRAFLDHVSMVPTPAYPGARVLSMRDAGPVQSAAALEPLRTPGLDEILSDPVFAWATQRVQREL